MRDGSTQVVEIAVECPKCRQESMVRVATGSDIDSLRKSIVSLIARIHGRNFFPVRSLPGRSCIRNRNRGGPNKFGGSRPR
jgi:hypothetical protein